MYYKIRTIIRYTIRSLLWIILVVLLFGALAYEGNMKWYVTFLNQRNRTEAKTHISWNPLSRPYLLLPTDDENSTYRDDRTNDSAVESEPGKDELDLFFAGFEDDLQLEGDDFGFAVETGSVETWSVTSGSVDMLTDEQKEQLLKLFKDRQRRIQAQQEFEASQKELLNTGDTQEIQEE